MLSFDRKHTIVYCRCKLIGFGRCLFQKLTVQLLLRPGRQAYGRYFEYFFTYNVKAPNRVFLFSRIRHETATSIFRRSHHLLMLHPRVSRTLPQNHFLLFLALRLSEESHLWYFLYCQTFSFGNRLRSLRALSLSLALVCFRQKFLLCCPARRYIPPPCRGG